MRTKLAILFTLLILTAQYAKQLSYMGCKAFVPENATCNCETILQEKEPYNGYAPTQHKHIHVDDFVKQNETELNFTIYSKVSLLKYPECIAGKAVAALKKVFRPPAMI